MQARRAGSTGPPIRSDLVPKPGGGHRQLVHLDAGDSSRYEALVRPVAVAIESRQGPGVIANRLAFGAGPSMLSPWHPARRRWRAVMRRLATRAPVIVTADVADCYGSVTAETVRRALRRCGVDDVRADDLEAFLRSLEMRGVRGLPIGPEPSALLANAVLATGDRALLRLGLRPFRWVDDLVVACPNASVADLAIEALDEALRGEGLRLHGTKTARWLDPAAFRRRSDAPPSVVGT